MECFGLVETDPKLKNGTEENDESSQNNTAEPCVPVYVVKNAAGYFYAELSEFFIKTQEIAAQFKDNRICSRKRDKRHNALLGRS